jgi:hypothetical protein
MIATEPAFLTIIVAFFLLHVLPLLRRRYLVAGFPLVGEEIGTEHKRRLAFLTQGKELYFEGYKRARLPSTASAKDRFIAHS